MISKKEVLKKMNISYGQLYRWKREGLIPDEWFIKKSVFSGQETFFDEDLIIPRIEKILALKDKYQLEQLKDILGVDNVNQLKTNYTIRELLFIDEIDPFILKEYQMINNANNISGIESTLIYTLSKYKDKLDYKKYLKMNIDSSEKDLSVYVFSLKEEVIICIGNYIILNGDFKLIEKISTSVLDNMIKERIGK